MSQKYIMGRRAQTRTKVIRYTVWIGLLLTLLAVMQVSFFPRFPLFGGIPDLMIVAVLCLSCFREGIWEPLPELPRAFS